MTIWVVTGPTASGKSSLAMALTEHGGGPELEILSMDSMAIYRRMDIGTAKPSAEERARVPHHLIDIVDPNEGFDTHRYCEAAEAALRKVQERGRQAVFVGGTPLYLMTFFKGMVPGAPRDDALRDRLRAIEQNEPGTLHRMLLVHDPEAATRIHKNDERRLTRALEVLETTGQRLSEQQQHFETEGFRIPCRILAVRRERDELHDRVKHRTIQMLREGLVEETRQIRDDCGFSKQAAAAIGYAECLRWLGGGYKDEEELRNMIRRATHKLIRRQTTWLRRIPEITWIEPDLPPEQVLRLLQG